MRSDFRTGKEYKGSEPKEMTDSYSILGISREASNEDIKKVYRALSRKYHPDVNISSNMFRLRHIHQKMVRL